MSIIVYSIQQRTITLHDCLDKQRLFEIQVFQRNNFTNQLVGGFLYAVSARS